MLCRGEAQGKYTFLGALGLARQGRVLDLCGYLEKALSEFFFKFSISAKSLSRLSFSLSRRRSSFEMILI